MFLDIPRYKRFFWVLLLFVSCAGPARNLNPCNGAFSTECGRTLFEEPPIESFSNAVDEVYRCWLDPGWGMSDVVRVEKSDASITLIHKDYSTGSEKKETVELESDFVTTQRLLTPEEWEEITTATEKAAFWDTAATGTEPAKSGDNCPSYIAEGSRTDGTRSLEARCPAPGAAARMCDALFAAAGIHTGW